MSITVNKNSNGMMMWGVGANYATADSGPTVMGTGKKITVPYPNAIFICEVEAEVELFAE